jgi:hypothetical protein
MPPALTPTQSLHLSKFSKAYKILGWGGGGDWARGRYFRARSLLSFTLDPARKPTHRVVGCCGFLFFPLNHPYDFREGASQQARTTHLACLRSVVIESIHLRTKTIKNPPQLQSSKKQKTDPEPRITKAAAPSLLQQHYCVPTRQREAQRERETHRPRENDTQTLAASLQKYSRTVHEG